MQSDGLTLYKLIILFILDKVDFPLSNAQLIEFILEKEYTNYFNVQQAISEIKDAKLVTVQTVRNSSLYRITDSGRQTIHLFDTSISDAIKKDIMSYLKERKYELRQEVSVLADYYEGKKNEYIAHCIVKERDSNIIELSLNVPSEENAIAICDHWKEKSQEVYAFLMKTLMSGK